MPAPSLTALLDIESQILFAAQKILTDAGIPAALPGDPAALPDDCTLVKALRGAAMADETIRPGVNLPEYHRFNVTLEISSRMLRSANVESAVVGCYRILYERRAKIRSLFLKSARKFTLGVLPWLAVTDIVPLAGEDGVDDTESVARDAFTERWQLTCEILPSAWPS